MMSDGVGCEHTIAQKELRWSTITPDACMNIECGDCIEGVGCISSEREKSFVRAFGKMWKENQPDVSSAVIRSFRNDGGYFGIYRSKEWWEGYDYGVSSFIHWFWETVKSGDKVGRMRSEIESIRDWIVDHKK